MTEILQIPKLVVVFGGSGFVGRHIVRALAKRGYRIRVAVRRPDLAGHLQPLGNVGQIQPVQANVRVRWSVDRAVQGADHVINLVAIPHESGRQKFNTVHEFGARAVAEPHARSAQGSPTSRRWAPTSTPNPTMPAPRRSAKRPSWRRSRTPSSSVRRSISDPRTVSSTASPTWRAIRRCCR